MLRPPSPRRITPLRLRSETADGPTITLRPPRVSDHEAWRDARLSDEGRIAPFWSTSDRPWAERHTRPIWIRHVLDWRGLARRGSGTTFVVEVDDRLTGELFVTGIDATSGRAEYGLWLHSSVAGSGVGRRVAELGLWYSFAWLHLERLEAPVAEANVAAERLVEAAGFAREAGGSRPMDVGGVVRPHVLWARGPREVSTPTHVHHPGASSATGRSGSVLTASSAGSGRVVLHDAETVAVAARRLVLALACRRRRARGPRG